MHKRVAAGIMLLAAILYIALLGRPAAGLPPLGDSGLGLPAVSQWGLSPTASLMLSIAGNIAIIVLIVLLNRTYNVLRAITWLPVGFFALMQAAVPIDVLTLSSGTIVALDVALALYLMFGTYSRPADVRTVFATFLLLSLGAAVQYALIIYIPVFWVICLQMRIMSPRCISASVLGILTPWVIMLGFGITGLADIHMPRPGNIFDAENLRATVYLLAVGGVTAFLMVAFTTANIMKTLAYNARSRAFNGAMLVVAAATLLAAVCDSDNLHAYLPLLNLSASMQITHYFINHPFERQYIGVLAVAATYIVLYLWRLTL